VRISEFGSTAATLVLGTRNNMRDRYKKNVQIMVR
jgi:hypothetical protein